MTQTKTAYVLQIDGLNLYLKNKQGLTGVKLTDDINMARIFDDRDNPADKVTIWNAELKRYAQAEFVVKIKE